MVQHIRNYSGERSMGTEFPMPNDMLGTSIVVASVTYRDDDIALVLLLNPGPPFFTVAHYYLFDAPAEYGVEYRPAGYLHVLGVFENIVPAIREYEQCGGDY